MAKRPDWRAVALSPRSGGQVAQAVLRTTAPGVGRPRSPGETSGVSPPRSACRSKPSPVSCPRRTGCRCRDGAGRSSRGMCRRPAWSAPSVGAQFGGGSPRMRFALGSIDPGSFPATPSSLRTPHPFSILYQRIWEGQPLEDDEFVMSADEKTSIQARQRIHPTAPPQPGRPMRVEHEYERRGAWAYLAALDVHRAHVVGRCEATTGIQPFRRLVEQVMATAPYRHARRVFWIVDNGSSHRGARSIQRVHTWDPRVQLVHTPCHASWLNQIEIYFAIVQRKVLTPNDFASTARGRRPPPPVRAPLREDRQTVQMDLHPRRPCQPPHETGLTIPRRCRVNTLPNL